MKVIKFFFIGLVLLAASKAWGQEMSIEMGKTTYAMLDTIHLKVTITNTTKRRVKIPIEYPEVPLYFTLNINDTLKQQVIWNPNIRIRRVISYKKIKHSETYSFYYKIPIERLFLGTETIKKGNYTIKVDARGQFTRKNIFHSSKESQILSFIVR